MSDRKHGRFPWGLTLASGIAFVLRVCRGVWQVPRLQWKPGLIAAAESAAAAPAVPLDGIDGIPAPFSRVRVDCGFKDSDPVWVELQSIHEATPGVRLIAACEGYIVDLGFIAETISARPDAGASVPVTLTALVREAHDPGPFALPAEEGRFFARDNGALGEALGVPASRRGVTLYAESHAFPDFPALEPAPPPAAFSNNHLGYALTWFGLAIALAGFYVALLRRKLTS